VVALLCLLAWLPLRLSAEHTVSKLAPHCCFPRGAGASMVAGAGVLALGRTAMLCSRFFAASLEWPRAALWMERVALAFDPFLLRDSSSSWAVAWPSCRDAWSRGLNRRVGMTPVSNG